MIKYIKDNYIVSLIFILMIPGIIMPLLQSGYAGDDTLSSLIRSSLILNNESVFQRYIDNIKLMSPSRLGVIQVYFFLFLLIGGNLFLLKIYNIVLLLLLIFYYYKLISYITEKKSIGILSSLTLLALIQYREYGDPIIAFFGITSLSILTILASIYYSLIFLEKKSIKEGILANILLILSSQMYEYNLFILIIFFITLKVVKNETYFNLFHKFKYFFILIGIYLLLTLYFRTYPLIDGNENFHSAYRLSFDLGAISKSFLKHFLAILPLSNIYLNDIIEFKKIYYLIILTLIISIGIVYFYIKLNSINNIFSKLKNTPILLVIALSFFIIPTFLISISPKYQHEIKLGMTYTNSLYMSVGFATILSFLLARYESRNIVSLYLGIIITAIFFNCFVNFEVVRRINSFWHFPRNIAVEAMKSGLMNESKDLNPVIISGVNYPWSISPFIYEYAKIKPDQQFYQGAPGMLFSSKRLDRNLLAGDKSGEDFFTAESYTNNFPYLRKNIKKFDGSFYHIAFDEQSRAYYFNYNSSSLDNGNAIFCRIRKLVANQDTISSVLCDDFFVYIKGDNALNVPNFQMLSYPINNEDPIMVFFGAENTSVEKKSKSSYLYKSMSAKSNKLVDPNSFNIDNNKLYSNVPITINDASHYTKIILKKNVINFNQLKFEDNFNIQISFSLDELLNSYQNLNAHLFGNHPGDGFQGIVCYKSSKGTNTYAIDYGNGEKWINIGYFEINDSKIHTINIKVINGFIMAYLDGQLIGRSTSSYIKSSSPLTVGGMLGGGRFFRGVFYNLTISENVQ